MLPVSNDRRRRILLPHQRQRSDRKGVLVARHRFVRARSVGRVRLCRGSGIRAGGGALYVLINIAIDILYGIVDVRVRLEG